MDMDGVPGGAIGTTPDGWMAAMRRGDHASAWTIADAVLAARDPATRDDPALPYHLRWVWDGQPPDGRDVLVRCYHGLGDTLQFARFLPELRRRAARVTLEVQPELLPLLSAAIEPGQTIAFDPAHPAPPSACTIEIMELSHALRSPPGDMPAPYLRAAADGRGDIGLCWQAGSWDAARSVPLAALLPLLGGRQVASLQLGQSLPEARLCPDRIAATAAVIAGLELVITVDSMVAHLAGALGRPTALLLKHAADWRWGDDAHRTQLYPATRLYRQSAPGDWRAPIAALAADLAGQAASPAAMPLDHAHWKL